MTPKQRLLDDKSLVDSVLSMTGSTTFERAIDATLLQAVYDMGDTTDPVLAAAAYHRIIGARAFLQKLRTIADQRRTPPRPTSRDNLMLNR